LEKRNQKPEVTEDIERAYEDIMGSDLVERYPAKSLWFDIQGYRNSETGKFTSYPVILYKSRILSSDQATNWESAWESAADGLKNLRTELEEYETAYKEMMAERAEGGENVKGNVEGQREDTGDQVDSVMEGTEEE